MVCANGRVSHNPTEAEVARGLGLLPELDPDHIYDVIVVGAGPAGLATAVYAASEGLSVLVLDSARRAVRRGRAPGSRIILDFLGNVGSGAAGRAFVQAQKFGATVAVAATVARLDCTPRPLMLEMTDGRFVRGRAVVVASGARTARWGWRMSRSSTGAACVVGPRRSRRNFAATKSWRWWGRENPPARRWFFSRHTRIMCTCWRAGRISPPACRAI